MKLFVKGRRFLSSLPPLSKVMCGIVTKSHMVGIAPANKTAETIGLAISDVYLRYATPLPPVYTARQVIDVIWKNQASGIVFALPMRESLINVNDIEPATGLRMRKFETAQMYLRQTFKDQIEELNRDPHFCACLCNEKPRLIDIYEKAKESPEDWEDINELLQERRKTSNPINLSLDAAVVLNLFLQRFTDGYQNTYG
jgi:hypothetical protein